MTLPTTIIDVTTATWSDHKNQSHGGAQRVTLRNDSVDDGTFYNLGDSSQYVGIVAGLSEQTGHKLLRVRCYLQRVGSPSGNVFIEARPQRSGFPTEPDMTTLWATSKTFPVSSIPTTGKNEIVFSFVIPPSLPSPDSVAFGIVLTTSVQGDSSNYIKVYRGSNGDSGGSRAYGSSTWNVNGSGLSLSRIVEISKSGARVLAVNKSTPQSRVYKTDSNDGASWSQEGSAGITGTATLQSVNAQSNVNDIGTTYFGQGASTAGALITFRRSEVSGPVQDPGTGLSSTSFGVNVSGNAPVFNGRRASGNTILVFQGATETVMGSARRRIKLAFHNGTSWSSLFDVAGSANTPDATLPGIGADCELRWAAMDPNGDFHIVYSRSDSSTLQYRKFKSDNTFATVNSLNSAVASATANYPVGQGTFYYVAPDWYVIIPYVDNASNTLKSARCKTTITETAANWTLTQIVNASAEVTASNPAVLVADNAQGGKVFCWRVVPTTRGLQFTDDGGSNTWKPETAWRGATQQVGGVSGFYVEDGIALVYLEESTTPDEVRYDRL